MRADGKSEFKEDETQRHIACSENVTQVRTLFPAACLPPVSTEYNFTGE